MSLQKQNEKKAEMQKKCFVISPIGDVGSEIRKRADAVFKYIILPIVKSLGYEAERADMLNKPGLISSQIIRRLIEDDLVIADLTGNNPNVLYELAIRHTTKRPVVQIMSEGGQLPFDVTNLRTIMFNDKDMESQQQCRIALEKQIIATEADPTEVDNPVIAVLDLISVRGSSNPMGKLMGDIYSKIDELPDYLQEINAKVNMIADRYELGNNVETNAYAQFIDGEKEAFATLTEVTRRAVNTVRSTRFFPESVLTQPSYVDAMEQRILGTDGTPPLKHYYRIVAINNSQKQKDINRHLNSFVGMPFTLYLTKNENAFELVIVDDTDAFIHFYKEEKVIASTLHIRGKMVVNEFIEIFNKLRQRDLIKEYNCEQITQRNLIGNLAEVDEIFNKLFPERNNLLNVISAKEH
jgi:hypothetical protein